MLKALNIRDYALIESLDLTWEPGMTAMTGETGSGKSIVLGALGLLLGHRSDTAAVRTGAARCTVEGVFTSTPECINWLESQELDVWDDVVIRREITPQGRSRAFINDTPVKATDLQALGSHLVDLHGQDGTQLLVERTYQLSWIDGHANHSALLESYQVAFQAFQSAQTRLSQLELRRSQPQADLDYLHYQLQELQGLELNSRDWNALLQEKAILENSSEIRSCLGGAAQALTESASDQSPLDRIQWSLKAVGRAASMAETYQTFQERLGSMLIELNDLIRELESEAEGIEADPERLAQLESWYNEVQRVLHKHNAPDVSALLALETSLMEQLDDASSLDDAYAGAQAELSQQRERLLTIGKELMDRRQQAATELAGSIERALKRLSIPQAAVQFEFVRATQPDEWGIEDVSILFSANAGQAALPLQKVASGGEKSRLMLAFKAVHSGAHAAPTIILDEIDTGVSGRVAEEMALLMHFMSQHQQVLAVTHLPQVAAIADHHVRVSKQSTHDSTKTIVEKLSREHRVQELASMLSGSDISQAAIDNAVALLAGKS